MIRQTDSYTLGLTAAERDQLILGLELVTALASQVSPWELRGMLAELDAETLDVLTDRAVALAQPVGVVA